MISMLMDSYYSIGNDVKFLMLIHFENPVSILI